MDSISALPKFDTIFSEIEETDNSVIICSPTNFGMESLASGLQHLAQQQKVKLHQFRMLQLCKTGQVAYADILYELSGTPPTPPPIDANSARNAVVEIAKKYRQPRWLIFRGNEGNDALDVRTNLVETLNLILWDLAKHQRKDKLKIIILSDLLFLFHYESLRSVNYASQWDYFSMIELLKYGLSDLQICVRVLSANGFFPHPLSPQNTDDIFQITGGHIGLIFATFVKIAQVNRPLEKAAIESMVRSLPALNVVNQTISDDTALRIAITFQEPVMVSKSTPDIAIIQNLLNAGIILKNDPVLAGLCPGIISAITIVQHEKRKLHMNTPNTRHLPLKYAVALLAGCLIVAIGLFVYIYQDASALFGAGYYMVLVLLGVAMGGIAFGIADSYIEISGKHLGWELRAGGPVAVAIAVVVGGYFYRTGDPDFSFRLKLVAVDKGIRLRGTVDKITVVSKKNGATQVSTYINEQNIVQFGPVPSSFRGDSVEVDLISDEIELVTPEALYKISDQGFFQVKVRQIRNNTLPAIPTDTLKPERIGQMPVSGVFQLTGSPLADSSFTITTVMIQHRPFPQLRVTVRNRTKENHLITAVMLTVKNLDKKKSIARPGIVPVAAIWKIILPLEVGKFKYRAKNAIEIPAGDSVALDLVFMTESADGDSFYHPSDIGYYDCRLALITDLKKEIIDLEPLRF